MAYPMLLSRADEGEAIAQTLLGYQLYSGKGAIQDVDLALDYFESAADQGENVAIWNLILIYSLGLKGIPIDQLRAGVLLARLDPAFVLDNGVYYQHDDLKNSITSMARFKLEEQDDVLGSDTFSVFCAGCHGFNGLAFFPNAPSFLMGERLE